MPELEVASESIVYLQHHSDDYFTCQHLRDGELVLCGLLTLEQIEARCPGAVITYAEVPDALKHPFRHPESRIIPQQTFAQHKSGKLVPAEYRFTVPKAGDYKLVFIGAHPFLDPEAPTKAQCEHFHVENGTCLDCEEKI